MDFAAKDFYLLFCNHKFKKVTETIQDGFSGMYFVLRLLSDAPNGLSAGEISKIFHVTTARTAVILATLKKKGFIAKTKCSLDARKTIVKITEKGTEALSKRKAKIFNSIDGFLVKLDPSEKENLYVILQKLLK